MRRPWTWWTRPGRATFCTAVLAVQLASDAQPADALRFASRTAALAMAGLGAQPEVPDRTRR